LQCVADRPQRVCLTEHEEVVERMLAGFEQDWAMPASVE